MPYIIICYTNILTLAIAPFLFFLVSVICEFAMVPGVYILLSPQEEEVHYSSWAGHKCTHSAVHSSKKIKSLSDIMLLCQSCCWIGKNTNKEFSCFLVFIMKLTSNLKFLFGFGLNNISEQSLPYRMLKISGFIFGLWLYDFWFSNTNDFKSYLIPCRWIKNLSAKTTKDIPKSNLNFIRVIKNSSFD